MKTSILSSLFAICCICSLILSSGSYITIQAQTWPQFRGINSSGIADQDANPPVELSEENLQWKIETPIGHSSPVIWGDKIFISGCREDEKKLFVMCIDRRNGEALWQDSITVKQFERVHAIGNAAQTTAATDGERVYFYFGSYGLLCYDVSGQLLWKKKFPLPGGGYGVGSSPILVDDKLILCRDLRNEEKIYAFNKISGKTIWSENLPERSKENKSSGYSTPVVWKETIVTHRFSQSTAHSLKDGSLIWCIEITTGGTSTPVINEDLIYFGAWHQLSEEKQRGELPDF